jgi:hypothetical protein
MMRLKAVHYLLALTLLVGCAQGGANMAPPGEYGLTSSVDDLVDRFGEFDVYASRDRATTTALVFDFRGDDWNVETSGGGFWRRIDSSQELADFIGEMRWAFGQGNRLKAIRAPGSQEAAGLVYSPALVAASSEGRTVTVRSVGLGEACMFGTVYFGSNPCIELRQDMRD